MYFYCLFCGSNFEQNSVRRLGNLRLIAWIFKRFSQSRKPQYFRSHVSNVRYKSKQTKTGEGNYNSIYIFSTNEIFFLFNFPSISVNYYLNRMIVFTHVILKIILSTENLLNFNLRIDFREARARAIKTLMANIFQIVSKAIIFKEIYSFIKIEKLS